MAEYKVPVLENFCWQKPVINDLTGPPVSPTKGHRYLVISIATGAWASKEKYIAQYNGATWDFVTPTTGMFSYNVTDDLVLYYNGSAWVSLGSAAFTASSAYVGHSLATAINDFLVASGNGAYVKKTLAETKAILGVDFLVMQVFS